MQLTEEGYGKIVCTALLATGSEGLVKSAKNAEEVVVLDGCPMSCAAKIAEGHDVPVGQNIIVTELGIKKGPSKSYTEDDIEKIVAACWAGEGRKSEPVKTDSANKKSTCGCGCGGSCD
ncbi:putative zinc-binding protein [Methanocorpusculum sp.]